MTELIKKISSYNLFNYLLPGAIFVYFIEHFSGHKILQKDMFINAFMMYFIGLVISRIGSLFIEYFLKKIVPHENYNDFIEASSKDEKIEILSEANNMYRTFIALFVILLFCKVFDNLFNWNKNYIFYVIVILLIVIFILAYIKQTKYIVKRVKHHTKKDSK